MKGRAVKPFKKLRRSRIMFHPYGKRIRSNATVHAYDLANGPGKDGSLNAIQDLAHTPIESFNSKEKVPKATKAYNSIIEEINKVGVNTARGEATYLPEFPGGVGAQALFDERRDAALKKESEEKDFPIVFKDATFLMKHVTFSMKEGTLSIKDATFLMKHVTFSMKEGTLSIKDAVISKLNALISSQNAPILSQDARIPIQDAELYAANAKAKGRTVKHRALSTGELPSGDANMSKDAMSVSGSALGTLRADSDESMASSSSSVQNFSDPTPMDVD